MSPVSANFNRPDTAITVSSSLQPSYTVTELRVQSAAEEVFSERRENPLNRGFTRDEELVLLLTSEGQLRPGRRLADRIGDCCDACFQNPCLTLFISALTVFIAFSVTFAIMNPDMGETP